MLDEIDKRYWYMVHPPETIGYSKDTDISVSCPLCQEGKSWLRKHRLHLYTKPSFEGSVVACFNCGYSSNLYNYLRENHPQEYIQYKRERKGESFDKLILEANKKSVQTMDDFEAEFTTTNLFEDKNTPNFISKQEMESKFSNIPEDAIQYLNSRGLKPKDNWLYSKTNNEVVINDVKQILSDFIIIPLTFEDGWYGFQALAWKQKKFFIYMLGENEGWKVWNWDNIDKNRPVYIFESIYDALSSGLNNVIAQLGANLSEDRIKELKEPIFCLDNQYIDEKAKTETTKYISRGFKCFIWPKGAEKFKDTNDLRKINIDPTIISKMITNNVKQGMKAELELMMM